MMQNYRVLRQPELRFRRGAFRQIGELLKEQGYVKPILVTGGRSIRGREEWSAAQESLLEHGYEFLEYTVRGEPGPDLINGAVQEILRDAAEADVVVTVGGGSVTDAGKAIAAGTAMGTETVSFDITRYLEGVGDTKPDGRTLPLIAFPTTAGTGSESTMNAVIRRIGPGGFKKSLRHPRYVPSLAIIDADLHLGCPPDVTRASGLDAITQLLEAYLSTAANPVTDALALLGLESAGRTYPYLASGDDSVELRVDMALAAYLSGVCLATAGLGVVHGYASPLGSARDVPHGVVCGLLVGPVTRHTLSGRYAERRDGTMERYAFAARALGLGEDATALPDVFDRWAQPLGRLRDYGFDRDDLPDLVAATGLKNHPVELDKSALRDILEEVL